LTNVTFSRLLQWPIVRTADVECYRLSPQ